MKIGKLDTDKIQGQNITQNMIQNAQFYTPCMSNGTHMKHANMHIVHWVTLEPNILESHRMKLWQ